jgi:signal transduction histidine kinase
VAAGPSARCGGRDPPLRHGRVRALPGRPDEALRLASVLSGTTASALRELKSTVGLLRQAGDADKPLEPTPGLAQLPDLAASFQTTGLEVTITTEGEPGPLCASADLTVYRIVQEALTNVTKHAAACAAEVRLVYSSDRLAVTVADDGGAAPRSPSPPGGGYGVMGMRERARSVGGRIRVGPRDCGGYEVVTELPLGARLLEETPAG